MDDGQWHKTITDGRRDSTFEVNKISGKNNKGVSQRKSAILSLLFLFGLFVVLWFIFTV